MPFAAAGQLPAGENTPTRLVLFAAVRTVTHYELPFLGKLRRLLRHENDELTLRWLTKQFAEMAAREIAESDTGSDPAVSLARSVVAATTMAWKVRAVAQGAQAMAPSDEAWELFAMIATVVFHRSLAENDTLALLEFIESMAGQISEL